MNSVTNSSEGSLMNNTKTAGQMQETECGIHWYSHTLHPVEGAGSQHKLAYEHLQDVLAESGNDTVWEERNAHNGYQRGIVEINLGIRIEWSPATGGEYCTVNIPGDACDVLGFEGITEYHRRIQDTAIIERLNMKRLDLALDTQEITPGETWERLGQEGFHFQGQRETLRRQEQYETGDMTVYLGSRQSDRHVRIYDQRGPTRVELVTRDSWAAKAWECLGDRGAECIPGLICDYVNFQEWDAWSDAMNDTDAIRLRACATVREIAQEQLERKYEWVRRCAASFAKVAKYKASQGKQEIMDFVYNLIADGEREMEWGDYRQIAAATGNPAPPHLPGRYRSTGKTSENCPF